LLYLHNKEILVSRDVNFYEHVFSYYQSYCEIDNNQQSSDSNYIIELANKNGNVNGMPNQDNRV